MNKRTFSTLIALACVLVAALAVVVAADAASTNAKTVKSAVKYMGSGGLAQWGGGGYASTGFKTDAVSALAAAKKAHISVPSKTRTRFIEFIESNANDYIGGSGPTAASQAGKAGKLVLGAVAAGKNPKCFGPSGDKLNLVSAIDSGYSSSKGQYGNSAFDHALAILALKAAHEKVPSKAIKFARERRGKYGWNFSLSKSAGDDIESTALMIQALRAAGVSRKDGGLKSAYRWVTYQRNTDGGFNPGSAAGETQADTTSYAVMAGDALGYSNNKAKVALRRLQKSSDPAGAFRSTPSADGTAGFGISTSNAVLALSGAHFPVVKRSKKGQPCG